MLEWNNDKIEQLKACLKRGQAEFARAGELVVETLEDVGGLARRHPLEELRRFVGVELGDEIRDVLGVDLLEELPHLLRIVAKDLAHVVDE